MGKGVVSRSEGIVPVSSALKVMVTDKYEEPEGGFWTHEELANELKELFRLHPSNPEEKQEWVSKARRIADQLAHIPDIERHPFHYATYFVDEVETFSRRPDYYDQEKEKISRMLAHG